LAIVLSYYYPRGRWLFTIFAGLAMLQRLDAHAHYLSDVLAGAALAFLLAAIYAQLKNRQQAGLQISADQC
jgi:membrane-associated phospholipid phosphatase